MAIIEVENLGKKYDIGEKQKYLALRDSLAQFFKHPLKKIAQKFNSSELKDFWALQDVSFKVEQGEVLGVIGRNGAGKSTLLKILSRITPPTKGKITLRGRVGSLLEVGTGFHPELTGRENIYLNGAVLGMRKKEIERKFDEIVDFAGIEKFLDTPVKRYSSGMYVRLAFAVAAHLEPEILIVDEVLAVGDAEFQKKCLGKMEDITKKDGRTVLFVSHNMGAIQNLCTRGLLLEQGQLKKEGVIDEVVVEYLQRRNLNQAIFPIYRPSDFDQALGYAYQLRVENLRGEPVVEVPCGVSWQVRIKFKLNSPVSHFLIALCLKSTYDVALRTSFSIPRDFFPGEYEAVFKYSDIIWAPGVYTFILGLSSHEHSFHYVENVGSVTISQAIEMPLSPQIIRLNGVGPILNPLSIDIIRI